MLPPWVIAVGIVLLSLVAIFVLVTRFYRKVDQGQALIINKTRGQQIVTFTGGVVIPVFHRAEIMEISLKTIDLERRAHEGLICKDNIRADIKVTFFVRVNKTAEDVLKVAQSIGCKRASDQKTLEELFIAKFAEALKTVGKKLDFVELYEQRNAFKDAIVEVIGEDLNGYVLEDAAIDYLEQTPLSSLDANNILDAQGIRKITELTATQRVLTNNFQREEQKAIKKQDVEAREAILALERQEADAEAKQQREIDSVKAREAAETARIQAEEHTKAQLARLKAEEEIQIQAESKKRQVEVAEKNRERVVAVESERVEKDRQLEVIARERETELQRIDKEKALEVERKAIADVVRARVAVDKTVAEEEEGIKTLRVVEEANRQKDAGIIEAEGLAQRDLVQQIKAAEAAEEVAKLRAKEKLTLADAELAIADKNAQAKIRLAEGVQAEEAASGLAKAKVLEATAIANEKQGLVDAKVTRERMLAEAEGTEKQGLAAAKVQEVAATALEKEGLAAATVEREKLRAEASGIEAKGEAEALAIRQKLEAEAKGLSEKAEAMKALDGVGREHEEYRLELERKRDVELAAIEARRQVAESQAHVLATAMANAKFEIVGGDGQFFERFVNAVTFGKQLDGAVDHSDTLQATVGPWVSGERSLPEDLTDVLTRPAIDAQGVQALTLSAALGKLMAGADGDTRAKLAALANKAQELGLDARVLAPKDTSGGGSGAGR